jgi:hypothetical protein
MPLPRYVYLGSITVLGAATLALSTLECFQHSKWRFTRAFCFALLGLTGIVPWGHVLVAHRNTEIVYEAMKYDAMMGIAYLSAASVYALRVPEKWYPGRFDLWMHSHQIFHVLIVIGCYLHYMSVIDLVKWRDASGGCALELTRQQVVEVAAGRGDGLLDVDSILRFFQSKLQGVLRESHGRVTLAHPGDLELLNPLKARVCAWDG